MTWVWVVAALVVLIAIGGWVSWTADRLDRLHHRIEVGKATLDAQLLRRSGTALDLAASGLLDPARSLLLLDAAQRARASVPDFETAESDLSESLRAVFADAEDVRGLRELPQAREIVAELADDCAKVELARRFHNNAVVSARTLGSRRRVRWLHLRGHAGELQTVDLDDTPPPALLVG